MAKTESTAVNELIELVQTQTPRTPDPSEDLMFNPRPSSPSSPKIVAPPPASTTLPPMRGDVPPLPRRSASGTQRSLPAIDLPPPVRVTAAPPSRATSIPPIPGARISQPPARATLPPPIPRRPSSPPPVADGTGERFAIAPAAQPSHGSEPDIPITTEPVAMRETRPSLPPPRRSRPAPRPSNPMIATPIAPVTGSQALVYPSAAPYLQYPANDMTSNQEWFDQAALETGGVPVDLTLEPSGTARVAHATDWRKLLPKLIAPTVGLIVVGVLVGGYIASRGKASTTTHVTAPEPASAGIASATPAPAVVAPEPAAAPIEAAPTEAAPTEPSPTQPAVESAAPSLVDVRIDSKPAGATVMLVDRGKTAFLGSTPISPAVDPAREYDLVLTYADRPPQIEHLVPSATHYLAIELGKHKKATAAEPPKAKPQIEHVVEPLPKKLDKVAAPAVAKPEPRRIRKVEGTVVDPFAAAAPAPTPAPAPKAEPKPTTGDGVLMISSKPPCEIYVDGAPTGLTTPQRALKLPAGKHKVTLVNSAESIHKIIPVTISGDRPTKVIQNFMK